MQISKLEISRFVEAYKEYKVSDGSQYWLDNANYLRNNGFELTGLIEELVDNDYNESKIVEVLIVLGVEVQ